MRRTRAVPTSGPLHFKNKLPTAGRERFRLHQAEDGNRKWEREGNAPSGAAGFGPRAHLSEQDPGQQRASVWCLIASSRTRSTHPQIQFRPRAGISMYERGPTSRSICYAHQAAT